MKSTKKRSVPYNSATQGYFKHLNGLPGYERQNKQCGGKKTLVQREGKNRKNNYPVSNTVFLFFSRGNTW